MRVKPLPGHIIVGVCGECNTTIGIISQDSMYGEGMLQHFRDKEHNGMQIVSIPKHIIRSILEEFVEYDDDGDTQKDPHEELLSPS